MRACGAGDCFEVCCPVYSGASPQWNHSLSTHRTIETAHPEPKFAILSMTFCPNINMSNDTLLPKHAIVCILKKNLVATLQRVCSCTVSQNMYRIFCYAMRSAKVAFVKQDQSLSFGPQCRGSGICTVSCHCKCAMPPESAVRGTCVRGPMLASSVNCRGVQYSSA